MAHERKKGDSDSIIPSTLTEIALLLLFGFMLVAQHFAKEAEAARTRADEAEALLRSRTLPSCFYLDAAKTRIGYFLIAKRQAPDRYLVHINNRYLRAENNPDLVFATVKVPAPLSLKYADSVSVDSATLNRDFDSAFTNPLPAEDKRACQFHAGIDAINAPPATNNKFVWSKYKP